MGILKWKKYEEIHPHNKEERELCWKFRDVFFSCLDKHDIQNSLDKNEIKLINKKCMNEKTNFENKCVKSWINYFQKKRYSDFLNNERYRKSDTSKNKLLSKEAS